jgi:nucleotide-binding universal stress UspA family protein
VETAVLGSVSAAVVDHATCPVLVARGDHAARVILAEDGSPAGMAARDIVASWPAFATIPVLVGAWTSPRRGSDPPRCSRQRWTSTPMIANARTTHHEIVAATEAHLRGRPFGHRGAARGRSGRPAPPAATDPAGDLIVVGSRGRGDHRP